MTEEVTNRQLFFIIVITICGFSVIELPKILAQSAGTGAWVTLLISAILFSALASVIAYLGYVFPGKTMYEYSQLLVGKFLTYIFTSIYLVYFVVVLAYLNRGTAEVIKVDLLFKTPTWFTMGFMLLFFGYAASKGITNVGRILELYGAIVIVLAISIHIGMFIQGDFMNIMPFYDSDQAKKYITALPDIITSFLGFEVLIAISFSKQNGKKSIAYIMGAVLFIGLFYVFIVETSFMVLSVEDAKYYQNALIAAMRRVELEQLQFLVRLDIVFFIAWILAIFSTLTVVACTASTLIGKLLPFIKSPWGLIMVLAVAYTIGTLPSTEMATKIFTIATKNFGLIPAAGIPIILLVMTKVKKYG